MDCIDTIRARHSIRSFAPTAVDPESLRTILESALRAPSAGNLQAFRVYVVSNPVQRKALAVAALEQMFIAAAPIVLVFAACPEESARKYKERGARLYAVQDATIACSFAMLAATALALGSVWVGAFDVGRVRKTIGAPDRILPVALLPVGYAAEVPFETGRRPINELVQFVRSSENESARR
jgi:nitroreductase